MSVDVFVFGTLVVSGGLGLIGLWVMVSWLREHEATVNATRDARSTREPLGETHLDAERQRLEKKQAGGAVT